MYQGEGISIVADESMKTAADVPALKELCAGVNVKLEKSGGIRGGLKAITAARDAGLIIWVRASVCFRLCVWEGGHSVRRARIVPGRVSRLRCVPTPTTHVIHALANPHIHSVRVLANA